jgi:hypothetical protein
MSIKTNHPAVLYYGNFYDTTTQTNAGSTSANLVTINTTQNSKGITVGSQGKITFQNAGAYLINFLGQFAFTGGASNYEVTVWYAKNGTIVPNSSYTFTTTSAQGAQTLANLEDICIANSGDYIQIYWSAQATGMALTPTAAGTNPTRPVSPSCNLVVYNVG